MLLIENNLGNLLERPHPFVIPVFPRLAPPTLVLSEHFVLKDLPFYEVTWLFDFEVRQSHFDTLEKKLQDGTLHQAPASASRPASNSTP